MGPESRLDPDYAMVNGHIKTQSFLKLVCKRGEQETHFFVFM